ncbi:hypothetical protein [Nisaea sp.]|uniref:hypothetical protein n=1 Tax=Nisaea sp. TaxID=2024842 RepID=UPI0032ED6077
MGESNFAPDMPNFWGIITIWILPIVFYYLGILIRRYVFPSDDDMEIKKQFVLGFFVGGTVLFVMTDVLQAALQNTNSRADSWTAYLVGLFVMLEHGLIVQESGRQKIASLIKRASGGN